MSTATETKQELTPIYEALREYLALRNVLADLESHENECQCDGNNFHTCELCEDAQGAMRRQRCLMDLWGEEWAVALETALPFQVWCKCGHISGQHAAHYPHKCAVDGGCEKECYGFRSEEYAKILAKAVEAERVIRQAGVA